MPFVTNAEMGSKLHAEARKLNSRITFPHISFLPEAQRRTIMVPPQYTTHNPCFCSINQFGVGLLRCGRPREAADVLANGLKEIRHAMTVSMPGSSSSYYACTLCHSSAKSVNSRQAVSHETSPPIFSIPRPQSALPGTRKNLVVVVTSSSGDDCTIQGHEEHKLPQNTRMASKGFIFSCPFTAPPNASFHDYTFDHWCFMMLYNLALSYDAITWSNHGTTNNTKNDQLALSFYQLAYRVQQNNNLEIPVMYLCGMLNNMARLHRSRREMDAVRQCLASMMTILMYITTQNQLSGLLEQGRGDRMDEQTIYYMAQFWNSVLTEAGAGIPPMTAGAA